MDHDKAMARLDQNLLEINHILESGPSYFRIQVLLNRERNNTLDELIALIDERQVIPDFKNVLLSMKIKDHC